MNYHVFIVDEITFRYHLEYMFAGTGAKDKTVPFLLDSEAPLHYATERNLVGMIADISRVREGDKIIFYLQATQDSPGMFYGVFKAVSTSFFDENDKDNFLKEELNKALTFRIIMEPDCVFPLGVSEHEYLDSLQSVDFPYQMCWSLIYRKLKGNRGCTMIMEYEFERLVEKLKAVNNGLSLNKSDTGFTFNAKTLSIETCRTKCKYSGRMSDIDIKRRMLFKGGRGQAFEVHLQSYIMQNFDKSPLKELLLPCANAPCWIGNEVSCGVGMQRIDIMVIQEINNEVFIKIVELKYVAPYMDILEKQLPWYVLWVKDYVAPNYTTRGKNVHIIPCVLAANSENQSFVDACKKFNEKYDTDDNLVVHQAEYIGFDLSDGEITFSKT